MCVNMVFYNLTSKELDSMRDNIKYGTKEYFEYNLIEMVDSIYCYDNYGNDYDKYFNDKYIKNYYLDKSYCNGKGRLTKEVVEEVVKNRVDYLCENTSIKYGVYTDDEDVTYNQLVFNKESNYDE